MTVNEVRTKLCERLAIKCDSESDRFDFLYASPWEEVVPRLQSCRADLLDALRSYLEILEVPIV